MNFRNCWYSSMRGCHIFDENWKTVSLSFENRCSKCSKGPRQIPSRGNFFQQGKLFHCVWGKASKWMLSLSVTLDYSLEMLGKKIQKEGPSMQLDPWALRKKQISDEDHHWDFWWWSPLRKMFCSRLKWRYLSVASGDIQICAVNRSKISSIGFSLDPVLPLISDILFRHKAKALQMWLLVA